MASAEMMQHLGRMLKRTQSFVDTFSRAEDVSPGVIHELHLLTAMQATGDNVTAADQLGILDQDEQWFKSHGFPVPNQPQINKFRAFWEATAKLE